MDQKVEQSAYGCLYQLSVCVCVCVFAKEKGKLDEKAFASHFYLKKWNQTFLFSSTLFKKR